MLELNDRQLLRDFVETDSESAFATLITRHIDLVYSTALRFSGNPHRAEEITQAVFIILARKAGSLGKNVVLSGWLYQTARLTAANVVKGEIRRQCREREVYMQSTFNEPDTTAWEQIAPLLEDAMGRLRDSERNALILRFFENKTAREVAAVLQLTEAAAHKRVHRALEKLRKIFAARGVDSTMAAIGETISANSIQAAPAALAKTVTVAAMTKGAMASTSTLTLVKGALKLMAWTKMKTVAVIGVAVILATGTTSLVIKHEHRRQANEPLPENSWAFKGFATPEAAFQSAVWAMSKGDLKTLTNSYTQEFKNRFMETAGKGQSDNKLAAMFIQIAGMLGDFRIVNKEMLSNDELILHIQSTRVGNASVPIKKIGNEWKINGNLTADQENKSGH